MHTIVHGGVFLEWKVFDRFGEAGLCQAERQGLYLYVFYTGVCRGEEMNRLILAGERDFCALGLPVPNGKNCSLTAKIPARQIERLTQAEGILLPFLPGKVERCQPEKPVENLPLLQKAMLFTRGDRQYLVWKRNFAAL